MSRPFHWFASVWALLTISLILTATWAVAAQTKSTRPDGSIGFNVSTTSITRLSIAGDRIRRIVNDSTEFEMSNDEETGDVYFRATGAGTASETGYIVTESGITIGFTMQPVARAVEPVIVTITGRPEPEDEARISDTVTEGAGFSDDIAASLISVVREVAAKHVIGKAVPSGRDGRVIATQTGEGWKATVRLAVASATGRLVREQDFYGRGVLGVWIANPQLGPNERSFVIVVEGR